MSAPVLLFTAIQGRRDQRAPSVPSRAEIRSRLNGTLDKLDAEQLQIVEVVVAAIARGAA